VTSAGESRAARHYRRKRKTVEPHRGKLRGCRGERPRRRRARPGPMKTWPARQKS
jgi:hypothetical protein